MKRDEMVGHVRKLETHMSGALEKTATKLYEAFETVKKKLEAVQSQLEFQTAATERATAVIANLAAELAKTEIKLQTIITSNHDQLYERVSQLEPLIAPVGAIKADTTELKHTAHNFSDRFDTLEGRISALMHQLVRSNRPWWRKILG